MAKREGGREEQVLIILKLKKSNRVAIKIRWDFKMQRSLGELFIMNKKNLSTYLGRAKVSHRG